MKIIMPIPSIELSLNKTKGHAWYKHSALRKKARADGYYMALEQIKNHNEAFSANIDLQLNITVFHKVHKNKMHMDDDNLLSSLKSHRDGIFDALKINYGCDDRQIKLTILDTRGRDKLNPHLIWHLTVLS